MNFISAKNGNRVQNTIARDVVRHCIKQLMPRMKTLDISVIFKKIPEKENTIGTCLMQDNNRSFEIEIQKGLSFDEIVKTLCHEMVHVKQWETGEWNGDGEKEAEMLQYIMADNFWRKVQI